MFTIIVPTHDRPLLLQRTLQSLAAQIFTDFTVIVVDDSGAYLPPYAVLGELKNRFIYTIRSGEPGPAESRNIGLALAKSSYVLFIDDDDTFAPGHLQALAGAIAQEGNPELLFCDFRVVHEDRKANPPAILRHERATIADVTAESLYVINRVPNSCLAFRRDVIGEARYVTDLRIYEDWEFLLACLGGRKLTYVPTDTVNIHKSIADAPENLRRGNTRDDLIVQVMLDLYKKYPAPDTATRQARHALMTKAGVQLALDAC
jgi:glycosyltransferase involved in cell wall biosynthesis